MRKRLVSLFCALSILLFATSITLANSAQMQWTGTTSTGAIVQDDACPIVVEKEVLTFDVQEFPKEHYTEPDAFLAYPGKVTAEYTFHNPTDYDVSATLLFPFGNMPDYGQIYDPETDERVWGADTEKFDITIDGMPIPKTLRHTFFPLYSEFELERDMALLHDGFADDPFYTPELPVTRYTYVASGVDTETYDAASGAFTVSIDPTKTKVLLEHQNGGKTSEDGAEVHVWIENDLEYALYVMGEPLPEMPEWKFYENGACEDEIEGTMTLMGTQTMTFKELALTAYNPDSGILEHDWYNAMVASMNMFEWTPNGVIPYTDFRYDITDSLMRWYEYEIALEPGESIVNAVTAPAYPSIDLRYEPPVCAYTYLLSPAKTWAEFGSLEILVNTPNYITESSLEGFEKTETGYWLQREGLPEGELTFSLCAEAEPARAANNAYLYIAPVVIIAVALVVIVVVILIVIIIKKARRK